MFCFLPLSTFFCLYITLSIICLYEYTISLSHADFVCLFVVCKCQIDPAKHNSGQEESTFRRQQSLSLSQVINCNHQVRISRALLSLEGLQTNVFT
ncbi:hypothetical protein BDB00DRAFT_580069 [Zychaea mexicana]|uniref:uncharacterized protein n=1 Tax=Zychaea mexicana TaxID=64656 RepID=UPI0022FE54F2|nr:uncharacterized protein BDB00DRAFT_580069 [Zychaea mexicana]KAI9489919.1 hypothetical protein BDB00DRAFT_580069 [Zychaea mexicana]